MSSFVELFSNKEDLRPASDYGGRYRWVSNFTAASMEKHVLHSFAQIWVKAATGAFSSLLKIGLIAGLSVALAAL